MVLIHGIEKMYLRRLHYSSKSIWYNNGLVITSTGVPVSVTVNTPPTVSITSPDAISAQYSAPASIRLTADANDSDGTIRKVEFYNGTTLLATERYIPYSWDWKDVTAGNYTITVKAYDNNGSATISTPVAITISSTTVAGSSNSLSLAGSTRSVSNDLALVRDGQKHSAKNKSKVISLKVGPNPTSNILFVSADGFENNKQLRISVLSMSGTQLKTLVANTDNQSTQINVSSLTAGIYIVKAAVDGTVIYKQFEKQ